MLDPQEMNLFQFGWKDHVRQIYLPFWCLIPDFVLEGTVLDKLGRKSDGLAAEQHVVLSEDGQVLIAVITSDQNFALTMSFVF
jgi:hypothetical protein